ncbi:IS3 family transposase [Mesorhizobium sp. M0833]|uniref:IS3 family transposase n=1 Tax=Mesorhizobium sp. M0833 TaxID=2957009 RepID=UPI00333C6A07
MAEGCRLGIARSTYYDQPETAVDDTALVETMGEISDSFEAYGYRRMQAALRQRGIVVNHKKVRRLMREHDLQPRIRRRFIATTDSDHELPIFPNLGKNVTPDGPNQLWVSDTTYVTIGAGFVYVAVILDAWSRKVVGYAIGRSIDARLTIAALKAIERRKPPPGCVHHSDRGSQYAALLYRNVLAEHDLIGSMGRRGNPYDNAKAESFMKKPRRSQRTLVAVPVSRSVKMAFPDSMSAHPITGRCSHVFRRGGNCATVRRRPFYIAIWLIRRADYSTR